MERSSWFFRHLQEAPGGSEKTAISAIAITTHRPSILPSFACLTGTWGNTLFASDASFSCGSWVCTQGGWDSPNHKKTTEWFVVLSGARAVTDPDGTRHDFRAGDVVVLSKGWYGRWDITEQIHNVWINDAHDDLPGASTTPVVASLASFAPHMLERAGTSPERLARTFLDNGRTRAGFSSCAPGSFPGGKGKTAECVHIICGTVFLTNEDGSARRNCAGDTVVLADGWTGRWDVVERTDAVWASVTPP